ncbi:MAG: C39 family peptidase [Patescibacteria group bacterium]|jgi:hypothetical protein
MKKIIIIIIVLLLASLGMVVWLKRVTIKDWLIPKPVVPVAVTREEIPVPVETLHATSLPEQPVVPITPPDEFNLSIPFTSQAPSTNWDATHEEACEEASMLMAARFLENRGIVDKNDAEQAILDIIDTEETDFGYGPSLTAAQTSEVLNYIYDDLTSEVIYDFTWDDIKQAISQGYPVLVPAAGRELGNPNFTAPGPLYHMLVIKGYTPDYVITNDPGTRKGADYTYDYDKFYDAIHDWNDGNVPTGQKAIIIVKPI